MSIFEGLEGCYSCRTPLYRALNPARFPCLHYVICSVCQGKLQGPIHCEVCLQQYPALPLDENLQQWQGNIATIAALDWTVEAKARLFDRERELFETWRGQMMFSIPSVTSVPPLDIQWSRDFPWSADVNNVNSTIFHNFSFREMQLEAINATLSDRDVFLCLPTGSGKSLCYQLPAVLTRGLTLVVMPLLALIRDQSEKMRKIGVNCVHFQPGVSQEEVIEELITNHEIAMVFLTPEKLAKSGQLEAVLEQLYAEKRLKRLVVDEAHCVSKWGRTFRKDYLNLSNFRRSFPEVPIVAMTATATQRVQEDVCSILNLPSPVTFTTTFNRPNLHYSVRLKTGSTILREIGAYILTSHPTHTGLIYCLSIKDTEDVALHLATVYKLNIAYYHSKMTPNNRILTERRWKSGEILILASTIAFGMGIDKPDVRFVIHHSLPMSLDNYLQEAGRAGRDGLPADCILYYQKRDRGRNEYLLRSSCKQEDEEFAVQMTNLECVCDYCEETVVCRRTMLLDFFGETFDQHHCHRTCDNCFLHLSQEDPRDYTLPAQAILTLLSVPYYSNSIPNLMSFLSDQIEMLHPNIANALRVLQGVTRYEVEAVVRKMLFKQYMQYTGTKQRYALTLGPRYEDLQTGASKLRLRPRIVPAQDRQFNPLT